MSAAVLAALPLARERIMHRADLSQPVPDPVTFARDELGITLDPWQAEALRSDSRRMLLNVTRQGGKSTTAAAKAAHKALFTPGSLTLMVSPSLRQSNELFRKWRGLLSRMTQSPHMEQDTTTSATLANGSRVVSLPSSEATIRGYSAVDLLIEDEAARVPDDLYRATRPMLAVSNGQHILMSTPWGRRGHFHEVWESGTWDNVLFTALECPRISAEFLEEERRTLGPLWFASEYLCEFTDTEDSVFRAEDIDRMFTSEITPLFGSVHAL